MSREYDMIEKISYEIYRPCQGLKLKFAVKLAYADPTDKRRRGFHMEYTYTRPGAYSNVSKLTTVNIGASAYLSLESTDKTSGDYIMIGYKHLSQLKTALIKIRKWFYDDEFSKLYKMSNKKLIRNSDFNDTKEGVYFLPQDKFIEFFPAVIEHENEYYEGVKLLISGAGDYSMKLDEFDAFYEVITSFNLFQSAQLALNYLQRPPFGKYGEELKDTITDNSYMPSRPDRLPGRRVGSNKNDNPLDGLQ